MLSIWQPKAETVSACPSDGYLSSGNAGIQYMAKQYAQPQSAQTAFSQPNILKYPKSKLQKG